MAGSFSTFTAGKLHVGAIPSVNLTVSKLLPGLLTVNGPAYFGAVPAIGIDRATVSVGPPLIPGLPFSMEVTGVTNFIGAHNQVGTHTVVGAATKLAVDTSAAVKINTGACVEAAAHVTAGKNLTASTITSATSVKAPLGIFAAVAAPFKQFNIPHPIKEDYRLTYACLEGPEFGVYYRGKTKDKVIQLPEYWVSLVHEDSISVQLTPIGKACSSLHVKSIANNQITVGHQCTDLEYFYHVTAERKDLGDLVVEYKGDDETDYKKSPVKIKRDGSRVEDRYINYNEG